MRQMFLKFIRPGQRLLLASLLSLATAASAAAELRQYQYHQTFINACRADPRTDVIRTYWKDANGQPLATFVRLDAMLRQQSEEMLCATNAGIYDKQLQPLGLYIEDGKLLRRLNTRQNAYGNFYLQPNGVFVLTQDQAFIVETGAYAAQSEHWNATARYATQSGPLMIVQGKINTLFDPDSINAVVRNAVCVDNAGMMVLAIARNPISFYDFAVFLRDELKCHDALYLDGSISRMYPTLEANMGPAFSAMITVLKKQAKKSPQ
ncbi:phosphodiester glycosidase family protein [Herbaspirillum sp. alder98]|uniref:phosphodiester glycosidase family protein n=1 Tax=Herbaspirillum sp. alder98 TaxID=2913096 RepID=UPI001CD909F7|nr:phosphodiester glycosidase family protein [Herbaspirillum sp. alder98]MCA1325468.1 phosphodiester glycosidase family protein [Herbaspirillum sp. alder98]